MGYNIIVPIRVILPLYYMRVHAIIESVNNIIIIKRNIVSTRQEAHARCRYEYII